MLKFLSHGGDNGTGIYIEDVKAEVRAVMLRAAIFCMIIAILSVLVIYFASRSISQPIHKVTDSMRDISEGDGDLTVQISTGSRDEAGLLSVYFNMFVDKIKNVISDVKILADQQARSSDEISATVMSFSENIQNQSASLEEITSSVEEISAGMDSITGSVIIQNDNLNSLVLRIQSLSRLIEEIDKEIIETSTQTREISLKARKGEESLK